jgi:hypothetical protein
MQYLTKKIVFFAIKIIFSLLICLGEWDLSGNPIYYFEIYFQLFKNNEQIIFQN